MIVVIGASGNVGRPLVAGLAAQGRKTTAVTRGRLPYALPEGARHIRADLAAPESLRPALEGAEALFVLVAGALLTGGTPAEDLLGMAEAAGVRRVVLLSSQVTGTRPEVASHARLREFEAAVRAWGGEWTILRPAGFASNAYAWAETVRADRTVIAPFGDVALPVVDPVDIAEVASVVLREDGHGGRTYELTGPTAISPCRQAEVLGEALGAPLRFIELTREQARVRMAQFMPEAVVEGTLDVLGEPLPAERRVSPDVRSLLGRPATTFDDWAARNVKIFD
ncbi:NAD(P)H-binding protein [Streptomyces spinoverrucosus]|uniref:NAD(P)H-binding protein n=1 Tax=Streptomyces spinoverrucosus TaxID=284043 RepID=UPI0018C40954|nr:NAD(P)H-binding protein [Streptomyces spinoverrucosus]MBG0855173.1 NAD(P)H-binding protein [Streptomyces spinoverrucosus]